MSELVIWRPSSRQLVQAQKLDVGWTPVHACMQLLQDPCAQAVLHQVLHVYPIRRLSARAQSPKLCACMQRRTNVRTDDEPDADESVQAWPLTAQGVAFSIQTLHSDVQVSDVGHILSLLRAHQVCSVEVVSTCRPSFKPVCTTSLPKGPSPRRLWFSFQ